MNYPRTLWAFLLMTIVGFMALLLQNPLLVEGLRLAQFDQFQRWHPRPYTPVDVRVVDIDEASLKAFGQWPWPRSRIAEMVDVLSSHGASAIVFDVLFSEPDRAQCNGDGDSQLAAMLVDKPVVLGATAYPLPLQDSPSPQHQPPSTAAKMVLPYRIVQAGAASPENWLHQFADVVRPLPILESAAAGVGMLNPSSDFDGIVRRIPLLVQQDDQIMPSLSAEALRVVQGKSAHNYLLKTVEGGVEEVRIGKFSVPTTPQGEVWLHFTDYQPTRILSASHVLNQTLDYRQVEGKIVLIGSSAAGLMDLRPSPLGYAMPGVVLHAMALEQILNQQHLERPLWAAALEILVLAVGCAVVGWLGLMRPVRQTGLVTVGLLLLLGTGAWFAFFSAHWLLDAINPMLAVVLIFVLTTSIRYWLVERQRRWLREAFARYVSPNRVQYLIDHPEQLHLGSKRQECSFVFTDLAGFTPLMEQNDPAQITALLNEYLESLLVIAFKYDATLDRFVGDAVALLFSAPVTQPDHRQRALNCAIEMDAFATAYAHRQQAQGIPWGMTRIGVHCGEVLVGNFGGKTIFDYRALGDPINVTARLESANKALGTRICVSQAILEGCEPIATRPIGCLLLKGKNNTLPVSTLESTLDPLACCPVEDYQNIMQCLQGSVAATPNEIKKKLERLSRHYPHDPLIQLHHQRIQQGALDDRVILSAP